MTKLDIIDGLNSSQAKPANLNEDPVLKREAEKKKEKEAEKKLRTSVSSIGRKCKAICIDIKFRFMTFLHHRHQESHQRKVLTKQLLHHPLHQSMKNDRINLHH